MFTIRSVSDEGTFYLCKNWRKTKIYWKHASEIKTDDMYKTASAAKGALTKLLRVMEEYRSDTFYLIQTDETEKIINEIKLN